MRRIRRHLTFANVASAIALFVALSGGTAVALSGANTVFTDDIANDTQPAGGGNPAGGLQAADLRPGSVGTSEVAANSLNGGDINESLLGIVPNAGQLDGIDSTGFLASGNVQKLIYDEAAVQGPSPTNIATVGPYTIKADCVLGASTTTLRLIANGPAGTSDYMHHEVTFDTGTYTHRSGFVSIPASTDTEIVSPLVADDPSTDRFAGTAMLKTGSAVVQVDFNGVAFDTPGIASENCFLYGTATKGT
jgi:hypothetical protein